MQQTVVAPTAPAAPIAPTAPPATLLPPIEAPGGRVVINGQPVTSAQAMYQGYRAQRRELARQMESLTDSRQNLSGQLTSSSLNAVDRKGLEMRITSVDERIASLDKQIAEADVLVARSAGIPGAAVELPEPPQSGPPEEFWVLSGMLIMVVALPLTIAYARRIWRRSAKVVAEFPKELAERMMRVEESVESTALEVERIGEGQRFMTKLFTEGPGAQALNARSAQRIGAPSATSGNE